MQFLEFTVDTEQKILTCTEGLEGIRTNFSVDIKGLSYYEVLPRIFDGNSDAVFQVLSSGRPFFLKGYKFVCFYESFDADITISPVKDESDRVAGAKVQIFVPKGCSFANRLKKSQHLIDLGKTASMLAHGVRNPLNAIKGSVAYLKTKYRDETTFLEFAKIIEEEISSLDKFITGFLSTSFYDLERDVTDIGSLLKKLELVTFLQAQDAGIEISFRNNKVNPLKLNVFQIEHALLNVINNAIKATPPGGKIIVESKTEERPDGRFAVVEVSDNGPGMFESDSDVYSAPLKESASAKGKGFGLFITREIVQYHGGMLEIKSEKGKGTSVKLCFPVGNGEVS
jgi:two-component system nitrogen regulation sensor histidine kinase GlnL